MVDANVDRRFLIRVRMADRPGALAGIAGRVGAVRGDLVGIEILERAGGWVVDELLVELPGSDLLDLLVRELEEEDEVTVEEAIPVNGLDHDPEATALEVVSVLLGAESADEVPWVLCTHLHRTVRTDWVCVVEADGHRAARSGRVPDDVRLDAVLEAERPGSQPLVTTDTLGDDRLLWIPFPSLGAVLIMGRAGSPWRASERRRVAALSRVAAAWLGRLQERSRLRSLLAHPAAGNRHEVSVPSVPDDLSSLLD